MVTRVSTQLLPTLSSNGRLLRGGRRRRPTLRGLDAHPESELETKLVRGGIPGRDRDSSQMKRIGSDGVDSAEARAATAEQIGRHTSELQSLTNLVCRLLLEKKKHTPLPTAFLSRPPTCITPHPQPTATAR